MRLVIACDHGGLALKNTLKEMLAGSGHELLDIGTHTEESVDYPDFGKLAAEMVAGGEVERGILICGTGIGMSITANKIDGIRAALCWNTDLARLSRMHNDANILVLAGRFTAAPYAIDIAKTWLSTSFEGGRHQNRIDKLIKIEGERS